MPKKLQSETLIIKKSVYRKALRYAMSLNEVGFLFFGKDNLITVVVRVRNTHNDKANRFSWDKENYRNLIKLYRSQKYNLIAEGHSHSKSNHLKRPSKADLNYFKAGLHIIVFPTDNKLKCWRINKIAISCRLYYRSY